MSHLDSDFGPQTHLPLPYDPWDDWSVTPIAPSDDALREAIRQAMDRYPNHGPSRLKEDLKRQGIEVAIAVIHGVKAGM